MRWERFRASRFGPLKDYEVRFTAPMTVLEGENEAGKTTLMELGCGLFFGYMRRKEDRERLIQWGARDAVIEGDLRLEDGRLLTIRRTLRSGGASTQIVENGRVRELGDQSLELLQPIGREVYRNIYALTQNELYFPTQGAWAMLQNRLLSGQMTDALRPVSEVTAALQKEALSLWRPDKRGKPRMEELSRERAELEAAYREAGQRQEILSNLTRERGELIRRRAEGQARTQTLEKALEEGRAWRELRIAWDRIQALRDEAGDLTPYDGLPAEPGRHWEELRRRRQELAAAMEQNAERMEDDRAAIAAFTPEDAAVLSYEEPIRLIPGTRSVLRSDREAKTVLAREAESARQDFQQFVARYMPRASDAAAALDRLDAGTVRRRAAEAAQSRAALEAAQAAVQDRPRRGRMLRDVISGGVFTAALAVLAAIQAAQSQPWQVLAGLSGLGLATTVALAIWNLQAARRHAHGKERELQAAQDAYDAAGEALLGAMQGLDALDAPTEEWASLVERGQELRRRAQQTQDALEHADARIRSWQATFREVSQALLTEEEARDPDAAMDMLLDMLEGAKERGRLCQEAREELPGLERRQAEDTARYRQLDAQYAVMTGLLDGLGGATPQENAVILQRRRACADKADTLTESLRRDVPDLESRVQRLAEPDWPYTQEALAAQRQELEELRVRLEGIQTELGSLDTRIKQLYAQALPSEIAAQLAEQDEKMRQLARERDRLALALGVIRAAEKRYRQENQPEIIRNAAGYLDTITQGRYGRLALNETGDGVIVFCQETGAWLDPAKDRLSKGTLEQLYLSLRLSLMDHLDPEGETLPLFLDETLINWDGARTRGGLTVLAQIAERRQVLLFTCHPWLTAALDSQQIPYQHVRLSR